MKAAIATTPFQRSAVLSAKTFCTFVREFSPKCPPHDGHPRSAQGCRRTQASSAPRRGVPWSFDDFTASELALWQRARAATEELKDAFEAEGSADLWQSRVSEVDRVLETYESRRQRRYLYLASLPGSLGAY